MKDNKKLIGKKVIIIDKESFYYNEWGIVKDFDGKYYYVAIANGNDNIPIFTRNQIKL